LNKKTLKCITIAHLKAYFQTDIKFDATALYYQKSFKFTCEV